MCLEGNLVDIAQHFISFVWMNSWPICRCYQFYQILFKTTNDILVFFICISSELTDVFLGKIKQQNNAVVWEVNTQITIKIGSYLARKYDDFTYK